MDLKKFIEEQATQIETLEIAGSLAWWNLAITGEERYGEKMTAAKIGLRTLFSSQESFLFLKNQPTSSDPLLNRQATLLLHSYQENQIPQESIKKISQLETAIEEVYTNFRPILKGRTLSNNDLKKILLESQDTAERQEAWEASKMIGEQVEADVLKLISLRNEAARKAGFNNFYTMRLHLQEVDEERLFQLLQQIENLTNPLWDSYKSHLDRELAKRFALPVHELQPWHYQDPFFQEAPQQELQLDPYYSQLDLVAIARHFFQAAGFATEAILARSDLYEREKKNQHAFCNCIDRKQDIRILCNLRSNEYWMGTLLHELGHAVYDQAISPNLPFILRTPAHTNTTEASAMLFGRLSKSGRFLERFCGLEKQTADRIESLGQKQNAAQFLVFARWTLVMVFFERAMYQETGINLNQRWWELVERFQGIKGLKRSGKPDWAAKLHLACAPGYYHNYILGEMTASQLKHFLGGELFDPSVAQILTNRLYSWGAQLPWEETLEKATGEMLNPTYFTKDLEPLTN